MGYSTSAMLAYGYILRDVDIDDALQALFIASGGAQDDYIDGHDVMKRCGVTIATYGHVDSEPPSAVLAARTFDAGHTAEIVDLELPHGADQQLAWALKVLNIVPSEPKPRWILTASFG